MASWQTIANTFTDVRFRANRTSTDLTDATLIPIANKTLREIYSALIGTNEDWYAEIATFDIVANQREYTLPADSGSTPWGGGAVKVLKVELQLDGTNWTIANPAKLGSIPSAYNETDIVGQFSNANPFYTVFDNSFFVFSGTIAAVTGGGRIIYIKRPAEVTATSDTPDLPNEFLAVLATGILRDVYERNRDMDNRNLAVREFDRQLRMLTENQQQRNSNLPTILTPAEQD